MRVRALHIAESLDPKLGGTTTAIRQLVNQLAERGAEVTILLLDGSNRVNSLLPQIRVGQCHLPSQKLGIALRPHRDLAALGQTDVVHIHGLWRLHYTWVARLARRQGVPVVLSTHGMLEPFALAHHGLRKRVARVLYQDSVLKKVQCLHITAVSEADTLRRLGFRPPTAFIPWGIDIPAQCSRVTIPRAEIGYRRIALFLSRFHPIKGLDLLLPAWAAVERGFPEWDLMLAGYDENDYRRELEVLAGSLGISHRVIFRGPLEGYDKDAAFAHAELFLLPSRSENFGLSVGEAMAHSLPVITTTGTPWGSVIDWGCGWYIEPSIPAIIQALTEALQQPALKLREMGERGRKLVATRYSVTSSAEAMLDLYSWLLRRGHHPAFVRTG